MAAPKSPGRARRLRGGLALFFVLLFSGTPLAVSLHYSPEGLEAGEGLVGVLPACHWDRSLGHLTGWPCPACGLSRGFASMSGGDPARAFAYHRAAPTLYLLYWTVFLTSLVLSVTFLRRRPAA